jgi:hypothetical protein
MLLPVFLHSLTLPYEFTNEEKQNAGRKYFYFNGRTTNKKVF